MAIWYDTSDTRGLTSENIVKTEHFAVSGEVFLTVSYSSEKKT